MKKRFICFILTICLVVSCGLFVGCGNNNSDSNNDTFLNPQGLAFYLLDNDTYGVKIGNATELSCITIPEKYCDRPVTVIMESGFEPEQQQGADYYYKVNKVIISSNIEKIEKRAFYLCGNLTSVEFSEESKLSLIEDYAFASCHNLKSINLPSSLTYIGKRAFSNTSINYIKIPSNVSTIGEYAFCSNNKYNLCSGILCESLQSGTGWDENWNIIYYYFSKPEDKMRGVPYFYRSDDAIEIEQDLSGHFWKYENKDENIIAIWGVSDDNSWVVKNKYQIINGESYPILN